VFMSLESWYSILSTYDPSEEYSFGVYLSLIDEIKKILEE